MSIATQPKQVTPDQLLAMPDGDAYELVDGELVERPMGFQSGRIGARIIRLLDVHVDQNNLGWVLALDAGYRCFPDDPNKVRKPDVSFILGSRLAAADEPLGFSTIAPDLAVEVISPNDIFEEVAKKVREYLDAGVRLVWVVDPAGRQVHVHRADGPGVILNEGTELSGEDVVPGFRCTLAEIFAAPAGA